MEVKITSENDPRLYVGYDLFKFPFNSKYPPNKKLYGENYDGYETKAEGVLLYDFAVMGYDVRFSYHGKEYFLLDDGEGALSDSSFSKKLETFDNPMSLVENLKIEGKPLLSIMKDIDDIEPV